MRDENNCETCQCNPAIITVGGVGTVEGSILPQEGVSSHIDRVLPSDLEEREFQEEQQQEIRMLRSSLTLPAIKHTGQL